MVDNVVPTLVPQRRAPDIRDSPLTPPQVKPLNTDKEALFDSIAQDVADEQTSSASSTWNTFFTAALWFGYAVAIVVALVLVWSATKELMKALPH
jgi:hypothetical protein